MNKQQQKKNTAQLWVYKPALDLVVGCGAWSAPLLLLAYASSAPATMVWAVALYVLALLFNYPHYMATLYRAYHASEDFNKYRIFTVHITGLVLATVFLSHLYPRVLPWIFTLYLGWSPWHYSGQNYGLFMMFTRRAGASPTSLQRRALYAAFLLSYLILLVSMFGGTSNDPLFLSPGIPEPVTRGLTAVLSVGFALAIVYGVSGLLQQVGVARLTPVLTLISTQFLWFLLPSFLWLAEGWRLPASRYSTGVMAIMHSGQYLWITSYYAQREATSTHYDRWRPLAYSAVLFTGGIALFIPGPWLASYIFHYDFTTSFLIFTALVNLHHFILDGAIWKLRDGRIAALLLSSRQQVTAATTEAGGWLALRARWLAGRSHGARALRLSMALILLALAGVDRFRFVLSTGEGSLAGEKRAAALNPYDSRVQLQLGNLELQSGHPAAAVEAWKRAINAHPADPAARNALLQYWADTQNFQAAYDLARASLPQSPRDASLLVNYGLLALKLGHVDEARQSWQRALQMDSRQWRAHLYLADLLRQQHQFDDAIPHYAMFLERIAHGGIERRPASGEIIAIVLYLADCQAQIQRGADAKRSFELAAAIAIKTGDQKMESLVRVQEAEFEVKQGDLSPAVTLYQDALKLDAALQDPRSEAVDWYNYGLLLRRKGSAEKLVYACLWKARSLLQAMPTEPEAKTVALELRKMQSARKGKPATVGTTDTPGDSDPLLQQALQVK